MEIYRPQQKAGTHRVFVQPGVEHPETTDFIDADGKPILFTVDFKNGVAKVRDGLGRYMIDKKLANSSPIILLND